MPNFIYCGDLWRDNDRPCRKAGNGAEARVERQKGFLSSLILAN
ncbi:MAG: hypothetical protein FD169_510 [Bacillota bacterium]|nr:MAG: hypothetical protein FD169_510 [Bacillota bacterium]